MPTPSFRASSTLVLLAAVLAGAIVAPSPAAEPKGKIAHQGEPQKILMIGNSLTYTWNIPAILEHFATASNRVLSVTAHVAGGKGLDWHWTNALKSTDTTAKEAIEKGGFDLVIIQEFSNQLQKKEGQDSFKKFGPEYIKAVRDKSMQPMLYMAHPTAKEVKLDSLKAIIEANNQMADEQNVVCAPAAIAFAKFAEKYPKIALIDNQVDRKYAQNKAMTHPSPFGSYLAACTLYAAIYKESPVGLTFHAAFDGKTEIPIDADDAKAAQEIAWDVWQEYSAKHTPKAVKGK